MLVVEDESFLAELVVALQLVNVGFVVDNVLLILLEVAHLFLQGASDVNGHVADLLYKCTEKGTLIVLIVSTNSNIKPVLLEDATENRLFQESLSQLFLQDVRFNIPYVCSM